MLTTEVKVTRKRIENLTRELGYVSTSSFLRGLDLENDSAKALRFLKRVFPKSRSGSGSPSNKNEFGVSLVSGWKSSVIFDGTRAIFELSHVLEGNKRAETVLLSLDKGSKAYSFEAKDTFRFLAKNRLTRAALKSRKFNWVTIAEGRVMFRPAREGEEYTQKTSEFITGVLMPDLRLRVQNKIKSRLNRI